MDHACALDAWLCIMAYVPFLEIEAIRPIVSEMKTKQKKESKSKKSLKTDVEISSCSVHSPFLFTDCDKDPKDTLVLEESEDAPRKPWATKTVILPQDPRPHKEVFRRESEGYPLRQCIKKHSHWHRNHDEKLVEEERQAAYEQPLTEIPSGFLRAGPFGDRQSSSNGACPKKASNWNFWGKLSGRRFKTQSVELVEAETFVGWV